jgi:hypothetical protein
MLDLFSDNTVGKGSALDLTEGEIVIDDALNYPHTLD